MQHKFYTAKALAFIFLLAMGLQLKAQVIYQYGFENECGNQCTFATPFAGVPDVIATGLTTSAWATNYTGFISYDGSCGNSTCQSLAIAGNNYPANTTCTLSFTVTSGYTLNITGISFWHQVSNSGPATAAISINGTSAFANVALATTGNTGTLTPTSTFNNLTGTVTLVLKLTGATGAVGTFRLDDFVIDGKVTSTTTGPTVYNVTGGGAICSNSAGDTIKLSGSQTGVNYQLVDGGTNVGAAVAGTGSAITFGSFTTAGTYKVIATNTTTQDTATMNGTAIVTINAAPVATIHASDSVICPGHSVKLTAAGGVSYLWSNGAGTDSISPVPSSSGSYKVTVTGADNCTASVSDSVTVLPAINVTNVSKSICAGQTYNGHNANGTYTDTLSSVHGCDSIVKLTLSVTSVLTSSTSQTICSGQSYQGHTATGVYTDTLVTGGGCDSIVTLTLTVSNAVLNTNIQQNICAGYSYNGHNTAGVYTDTLTAVTGCDSIVTLTLGILPGSGISISHIMCAGDTFMGYTAGGAYVDTFTSANGCDSIVYLQLTVANPAQVSLTLAFDTICGNADTIVLTGGSPVGGVFSGAGVSAGVFTPYYAPYGADTLYYTYADSGCTATATAYAYELTGPHVTLHLPFDTICGNAGTILLTGGSPAGGYYSGAGVHDSIFDPYYAPYGTDTIYYTYTDSNGCKKTHYEYAYEWTPPHVNLQLPADTFCSNGATVTLTGGTPGGGTYSGTGVASGQFNPTLAIAGQDTIYYTYTDTNGCSKTWHEYAQVEVCTGIAGAAAETFKIYPNPVAGKLIIESNLTAINGKKAVLYDMAGRLLAVNYGLSAISANSMEIDMSELSQGIYTLMILCDDGTVYSQLVVKQ